MGLVVVYNILTFEWLSNDFWQGHAPEVSVPNSVLSYQHYFCNAGDHGDVVGGLLN